VYFKVSLLSFFLFLSLALSLSRAINACSVVGLFTRTATSRLADLKGRAHGPGGVTSLEVLGSGQQIFSGGCDGSVCVWDVRTGGRLAKEHGHKAAVTECGSLGGNNVLTTSLDGTMKVWNVSTMKAHNFGQIQPKVR